MNWDLLRQKFVGLRNTDGKTCYINAALQCLASTPPLIDWLFKQLDKMKCCECNVGLYIKIFHVQYVKS